MRKLTLIFWLAFCFADSNADAQTPPKDPCPSEIAKISPENMRSLEKNIAKYNEFAQSVVEEMASKLNTSLSNIDGKNKLWAAVNTDKPKKLEIERLASDLGLKDVCDNIKTVDGHRLCDGKHSLYSIQKDSLDITHKDETTLDGAEASLRIRIHVAKWKDVSSVRAPEIYEYNDTDIRAYRGVFASGMLQRKFPKFPSECLDKLVSTLVGAKLDFPTGAQHRTKPRDTNL